VHPAGSSNPQRWWIDERPKYTLVTSQIVIDEASRGDSVLVTERLGFLDGIPLLALDAQIQDIADAIMRLSVLPAKAQFDALHIAIASYHSVDYLLTWNCTHIANARIFPRIQWMLAQNGFPVPTICTPEEMVDDDAQLTDRD
jgi:hypothetical protein